LKENFDVLEVTDKVKALESTEGQFGYKGLHLDLKINEKRRSLPEYARFTRLRFEVQIRTIVQDAWSVLDHKIKYKKAIPAHLKRRINALAAQFETIDHLFLSIRDDSAKLEHDATVASTTTELAQKFPLDAFQFLALVREVFPGYTFSPEYVDGFVQEILQRDPEYKGAEFGNAIKSIKGRITRYRQQAPYAMNPYTVLRHILFLSDQHKFELMLFDRQRENLVTWLSQDKDNGKG